MPRLRQIEVRTYRTARIAIHDDGAEGWAVTIHVAGEPPGPVLRSPRPQGLPALLREAQALVDAAAAARVAVSP